MKKADSRQKGRTKGEGDTDKCRGQVGKRGKKRLDGYTHICANRGEEMCDSTNKGKWKEKNTSHPYSAA